MWIVKKARHQKVIDEIEKQTDRGVAIIATALIENYLSEAIKAKLINDTKVVSRVFENSGPLGTLAAKIDVGFLLGMYEVADLEAMHTVREIRNAFAHWPSNADFSHRRIARLCDALRCYKSDIKSVFRQMNIQASPEQIEHTVQLAKDEWQTAPPRKIFLFVAQSLLISFLDSSPRPPTVRSI